MCVVKGEADIVALPALREEYPCVAPSRCPGVKVLRNASEASLEPAAFLGADSMVTRIGLMVDHIYLLCGAECTSKSTEHQIPAAWMPMLTLFSGKAHDACLGIRGREHRNVALQSHKGAIRDAKEKRYRRVLVLEHDNAWVGSAALKEWADAEWHAFREYLASDSWQTVRLAYTVYSQVL